MSRDPEDAGVLDSDGVPTDPKRLHKYLYAGGDPVNRESVGRARAARSSLERFVDDGLDPGLRAERQFVYTANGRSNAILCDKSSEVVHLRSGGQLTIQV